MKPAAEMTREELIEEVSFLRGVMYGDPSDDDLCKLKVAFRVYPSEARILLLLERAHGRTVAKWRLEEEVPPVRVESRSTETNSLAVRLSHIRSAIGRASIQTVLGVGCEALGYRLTDAGRQVVAEALA